MARYRTDVEIPLRVERGGGTIPGQIVEQIRKLVLAGRLGPGDPVPSTRALAARLGVSRGSVSAAYDQLAGEGYLVADHGSTRVTPELPAPLGARGEAATESRHPRRASGPAPEESPRYDLRPGRPDTSALTTTTWRAAWRAAAAEPSLGYGPQGSAELRRRLADYVRTVRSVPARPEDILVTAGARDGLRSLLTALGMRLGRPLTVAVEDPGYPSLHRVPEALGHRVITVPLDEQGLNPARLPTGKERPDLVLITPSHQYPLGASMPVARRVELLRWAVEHRALLVEDDYDSELRYVGDPLPALAALDTENMGAGDRVVTLGSFAKTLTPGLGLGFLLMPPHIRADLLEHRGATGAPVSGIVQDAMTHFMAADGPRRHTARMRREYRGRRDLLARIVGAEHLPPGVAVLPMDGGLHAVLELPRIVDERRVVAEARRRGVEVAGLGGYWNHGGARAGIVVGFGGLSEQKLALGLEALRRILIAVLPTS